MALESASKDDFSGLRGIFWPIHRYELKKFLPMGFMMLCILFNYTILRDIKDVLVVLAPAGGAETISFLKLYGVTPSAILFMIVFVKLTNIFSQERLFYGIISFFIIFFTSFAYIIYPNKDILHMSLETIHILQQQFPPLYWLIPVIGNWSFSLFYILAELWGSVVLSMLFWQFANQITKIQEAKRFYGLFGMIGNFGLMLSGSLIYFCSQFSKVMDSDCDKWGFNLKLQMSIVGLSGILIIFIYRWMQHHVLTDSNLYEDGNKEGKKKNKPKLSLIESFQYIIKSPYLGLIAVMVLAYGISINLVEGVWKGQIKIQFPDENDYAAFMGQFSFSTGLITMILMFIGNNILRRLSWFSAAIITPIILLLTSLIFFCFIIYGNRSDPFSEFSTPFFTTTLVMAAVMIGLVQNVFSKATKYSLFDTTKQMAYIPLDPELKIKGQAAVEVIGGRAGKSGGAFIQSFCLMLVGGQATLASLSPLLGGVVILTVLLWCFSVYGLSKKFETIKER